MTTISQRFSFPNQALLFDLEQLYRCLQTVPDRRKRRWWRYPLAVLLMIGVFAKLAGQVSLRANSHWAKLLQQQLSCLFQLKRQTMPHSSTWSRVLLPSHWLLVFLELAPTLSSGAITRLWLEARVPIFRQLPFELMDPHQCLASLLQRFC